MIEGDSYDLIEKQRRENLKEKNAELVDAIIKQERVTERYKWELKKTGEALEEEAKRVERLRRENTEMKKFIQEHFKVADKASTKKGSPNKDQT